MTCSAQIAERAYFLGHVRSRPGAAGLKQPGGGLILARKVRTAFAYGSSFGTRVEGRTGGPVSSLSGPAKEERRRMVGELRNGLALHVVLLAAV